MNDEITKCSRCNLPAHASESDDAGRCHACRTDRVHDAIVLGGFALHDVTTGALLTDDEYADALVEIASELGRDMATLDRACAAVGITLTRTR